MFELVLGIVWGITACAVLGSVMTQRRRIARLELDIDRLERTKADKQLTLTITARDTASEALRRLRRYPEPPANG